MITSVPSDPDIPSIAISEYINGALLSEMDNDEIPVSTYSQIGSLVGKLHSQVSSVPGTAFGTKESVFDCLELVYLVMIKELRIACEYDSFVKEKQSQILETLDLLRSRASVRKTFNLIHGDSLQMMINGSMEPVLIDIDGVQYFDLEYEYCIMDIPHLKLLSNPAFMDSYRKFIIPECEQFRLIYYRICTMISWLSCFSEALYKSDNHELEGPYQNTLRWLQTTLEQVHKDWPLS